MSKKDTHVSTASLFHPSFALKTGMWISDDLSLTTYSIERSEWATFQRKKKPVKNIDHLGQLDSKGIEYVIKI